MHSEESFADLAERECTRLAFLLIQQMMQQAKIALSKFGEIL